jgi:hypothetical protein
MMRAAKDLALYLLVGALSGCAGAATGERTPPLEEEPDAEAASPSTPDARTKPDPVRPAPDAAALAADTAAPLPARDAGAGADSAGPVAADAAPGGSDAAGFPMGMRMSLEQTLRASWVRERESIKEEGGVTVFTGVFEANRFGGPQGHNHRINLKPAREYLFEYRVRFDGDFPFTRGGKIPGLAGGNTPTGCVNVNANGFSARMMWRTNGQLVGYIYDQTQSSACGNNITTSHNFRGNTWYSIKERVRVNTGNASDGILQIWVDDRLLIDRKNMRYMNAGANNLVNSILFHSFFGGSTQAWAPSRQCSISFAEVYATLLAD